jgi:hypothetical protein
MCVCVREREREVCVECRRYAIYVYTHCQPPTRVHQHQQEVRKHETFMPETTGVLPAGRVLDEEEDVCEYLYHEGMASLQRCVRLLFFYVSCSFVWCRFMSFCVGGCVLFCVV